MRIVGGLATLAMAFPNLPLFLVGALAPALVASFGIARPLLGILGTAGYGVGALLSLVIGQVVDAVGARRAMLVLFGVVAAALAVFAQAGDYGVLVVAIAFCGVAQALANPATNKLIASHIPVSRRGLMVGIKQSGVQLGALAAGLPLAALAGGLGWRVAVWTAAGCAFVTMLASGLLPRDPPLRRAARSSGPVDPAVWWLMGFQALLGAGTVAVNTYVALFATQDLGFGPQVAAALVAVLGIAGIAGRLGWSRLVANGRPAGKVLVPLGLGAAVAAVILLAAASLGTFLAWVGVLGIGVFAVSGNAVSMLVVLSLPGEQVGRHSALVSAGFYGGFAVGPPCFGLLVDLGGYWLAWSLVALEFAAAAVVGWAWLRTTRKTAPV
ncbi:MFS transporter [Actinocrispum sp. NPDC049592]|uniref:MFS transporter n=1 Tax=Actinocrispum sp. NPDC049592 TaxID=3154835 RepID=UPI00341DB170